MILSFIFVFIMLMIPVLQLSEMKRSLSQLSARIRRQASTEDDGSDRVLALVSDIITESGGVVEAKELGRIVEERDAEARRAMGGIIAWVSARPEKFEVTQGLITFPFCT